MICHIKKNFNERIEDLEPGDVILSQIKAGSQMMVISQSYLGEPDGFDQMLSHGALPLTEVKKIFKKQGFEIRRSRR